MNNAAGTAPGQRADPRQAEQQPGLEAELEDGVHAVQRAAVELVAHVQQLGAEQARQATGHEQPHGALRRRRGEDRIQRHGEQDGQQPRRGVPERGQGARRQQTGRDRPRAAREREAGEERERAEPQRQVDESRPVLDQPDPPGRRVEAQVERQHDHDADREGGREPAERPAAGERGQCEHARHDGIRPGVDGVQHPEREPGSSRVGPRAGRRARPAARTRARAA